MPHADLHPKKLHLLLAPPAGPGGQVAQVDYWSQDPDDRGLGLRVSSRNVRAWTLLTRLGGKTKRFTLGRFPDLGLGAAREAARLKREAIEQGVDLDAPKPVAITFGTALEDYLRDLKKHHASEATLEHYNYFPKKYLSDWFKRPLQDLGNDRRGVKERHSHITETAGGYAANLTLKIFRAIYNAEAELDPALPRNPIPTARSKSKFFNAEHRRKVDIGDLAEWWQRTEALKPVARDFHRMMLLSGMRPTALKTARTEHFSAERGVLHVPKPKGGEERAFDLPLSVEMIEIIRARIAANGRSPWIFADRSRRGHFEQVVEPGLLSGQKLRHVFKAMSVAAGVARQDSELIQNHSNDDVAEGYINRDSAEVFAHLRRQQERVTRHILKAADALYDRPWPERKDES